MKPVVTEHALLRFLERTGRINIAAVTREMLTEKVVTALKVGATAVKINGLTFVLGSGKILTVFNGTRRHTGSGRDPAYNGRAA